MAWVQARKSDQKSWLNRGRCILNAFGFLDISGVGDLTGDTFESEGKRADSWGYGRRNVLYAGHVNLSGQVARNHRVEDSEWDIVSRFI